MPVGKALAAAGNSTQTTFAGTGDGTYTNVLPANSGTDVALNSVLSNAGGSGWQYKRPITVTNGSGGALTDYQVQVSPFTDAAFLSNTGLVGSWHMGEGGSSPSLSDMSGNNYKGTLEIGAAGTQTTAAQAWSNGTTGKFGSSLNFDGSDDAVTFGDVADVNSTNTLTLSAWVKTNNTTVANPGVISKWDADATCANGAMQSYALYTDAAGKVKSVVNSTSNGADNGLTSATSINDNNWHLLTLTAQDGTNNMKIYIDGVLDAQGTKSGTGISDSPTPLRVGSLGPNCGGIAPSAFKGQIDEPKIYNRVLTSTEIANQYGISGVPKVRGDYADLRFTNAVTGVEYPYWQETDGTYWVKVTGSLPAGTNTNFLNMYYGNVSATSSSSGYNVFSDHFASFETNVDGFTGVADSDRVATPSPPNGSYQLRVPGSATASKTVTTPTAPFLYEARIYIDTASAYQYELNLYSGTNRVRLASGYPTSSTWGYLNTAGSAWVNSGVAVTRGSWTTLKVLYNANNTFSAWQNGTLIVSSYAAPTSATASQVQHSAVTAQNEYIDLSRFRKYAATEPTHSAPGTEAGAYNTTGSFTSTAQAPTGVYNWGALTYTRTPATTAGTYWVKIDLLNGTNDVLVTATGCSGTESPPGSGLKECTDIATNTNLSSTLGISALQYPSLKIKARFQTDAVGSIPTLSVWNLAYDYDVTGPLTPIGLTIGAVSTTAVPLSWTEPEVSPGVIGDAESGVAGYEVQRAPDSAGVPGTWANVASGGCSGLLVTTSCTDGTVVVNTKYYYRVRAKNGAALYSGYSGEQSPDANTVGLWRLNEGTGGTTADVSSNGNTGTITIGGTGTQSTTTQAWTNGANGRIEKSLNFDGTDDYINIPYSSVLAPTAAITAEVWAYSTSWSTVPDSKLLSKTQAGGYQIGVNPPAAPGNISFLVNRNSAYATIYSSSSLSSGWHHFAFTYDGRYTKAYIDGAQVGSTDDAGGSYPIGYTVNNSLIVGAEVDAGSVPSGEYFTGQIDEVRISNVARSGTDIQNYFNESNPQPKSVVTASVPVPTGLTIGTVTSSAVPLSWNDLTQAPTSMTNLDGYKIERAPDSAGVPGTWAQIKDVTDNATSWTDNAANNPGSPPQANTKYYYRLRAYDTSGNNSLYTGGGGATGGTITYTDSTGANPRANTPYVGGYVVHTFTSSSSFGSNAVGNVSALVVAGGGGGGNNRGGGGGAGGLIYSPSVAVTAQNYSISIGNGGLANTNGTNSVFDALTSVGGGASAGINSNGSIGGSGGGAGASATVNTFGGAGTSLQGNNGGNGANAGDNPRGSGGGGGAGSAGISGGSAPNGGTGVSNSISGVATIYAGGGGGGDATWDRSGSGAGSGGTGGGGNGGGKTLGNLNGSPGATNTGGGGGGGGMVNESNIGTGGSGGSGIVVIKYSYVLPSSTITLSVPVPTGLNLSNVQSNSVTVNWTANSSDTANYKIQRATDSGGNPTGWADVASGGCSGNIAHPTATCTDATVSANTKYYYRIYALNSGGTSSGYSGERAADANTVGQWRLNEGTGGTTADTSGNGNTGTMNGTSYWTSGNGGKFGESGSFSGDDYVSTAYNATLPAAGTVEAWIYPTSLASIQDIIEKGFDGTTESLYLRLYNNKLEFGSYNTSGGERSVVGTKVWGSGDLNKWWHVAGVYNGTTMTTYINGSQDNTSSPGAPFSNSKGFLIGAYDANGPIQRHFNGRIDEVRISNVARSAGDISAYYAESNPQPKSATTLPGVPTAFSGTAVSTSGINMTWTAPSGGADHYHVKYSGDDYASNIYNNTTAAFNDTGRSANTSYTYRVYSVNSNGDESDTYAEITKSTWSDIVTGETATADSSTQITVSWTAPSGGANHYHVRSSSDAYASVKYNDVTTSWSEGGLSPNTSYTYRIYSVNADNVENTAYVSTVAKYTKTNVPQTLSATAASSSQINLTWAAPTGGASRYHVKYSGDSYASNIYDNTTAAFNDTGRSANTQYTYRVYGVNADGTESDTYAEVSKYTSSASASVTADKTVNTWYNDTAIVFTNAAGFGDGGVTKYKYVWDGSATHTWTGTEPDEWTTGTLQKTMANGDNYLHVTAYNGDNIAGTPVNYGPYRYDGAGPTGTVSIDEGEYTALNTVHLTLSATDAGSAVAEMQFSKDGVLWCLLESYQTSKALTFGTDPLCDPIDTTQGLKTIYVRYTDNAGNISDADPVAPGNQGYSDSVTLDSVSPTNPTASVVATPDPAVNGWYNDLTPAFTLSGATDATSGVAGYYVYFGNSNTADPVVNGSYQAGDTFSPTIAGADSGKTFYLRVRAKDAAGNLYINNDEGVYTVFTYKIDVTNPAAINYITPSPAGWNATNSFSFSWPKVADIDSNGASSGVAGYLYRRKTVADTDTYEDWDAVNRFVAQPGGATVSLNNIEALYTGVSVLQVRAVDIAGNLSVVIPVNFYYSGDIPEPLGLTADLSESQNMTVNRYSFSWDKPAGVTPQGYYYSVNAEPDTQNTTYIPYTSGNTTTTGFAAFATKTGLNKFYVVTKANDTVGWTNFAMAEFTCNTSAPGIPTNVMITDSSARDSERWQLTVNWDEPTQVTDDFNGYAVERGTDGTNFAEIATTAAATTGYLDTNLLNVSTYYYRVKARDNTGNKSAASTVVSRQPTGRYTEPPKIIGDPRIEIQATRAQVSFTTERDADSFIQVGATTSYGMTQGQLDSTSSHEVVLSGLTPGMFYHYRAMWRDIDSNIGYSKDYTFRTQDAPGISEVSVSGVGLYSALVSWKTNTVSSSVVKYGKTNAYGSEVEDKSGSGVTVHVVKLEGLTDSTTYHFKISGTDTDGNGLSSDDYSFETLTFPRVSDVKITQKADEATSTVVVTWNTNVPTDSVVNYSGGGVNKESSKALLEQKHSITVSNLRDNTAYNISVGGRDAYGNQAEGGSASYKTAFDTRPPQITDITTEISVVGYGADAKGQVIVSWETDEPSTSQVQYDVGVSGSDYSLKTQEDSGLTTTHVVVISGLKPSTSYHFQVVSKDESGNRAASEDSSYLTDQASSSVLDIIVNSLQSTIGWIFGSFTRR